MLATDHIHVCHLITAHGTHVIQAHFVAANTDLLTTHHSMLSITEGMLCQNGGELTWTMLNAALDSMLARFAKMSPDGTYTPPPPENAKASYATLVYVRATIVEDAGWYLARSVTIAVRPSWQQACHIWAYEQSTFCILHASLLA